MSKSKKKVFHRNKIPSGTIKQVLKYVWKYPFSLLFTLILATVQVIFTLYIPVLIGKSVDCIIGVGQVDFEELKIIFIKIISSVLITAISQYLQNVLNNRITYGVVENIRKDAFRKITVLPLKYLDSNSHGDLVSRIISDADTFADGLLMGFTQFFSGVLTIIGTLVFMALTDKWLALLVVILTPLSLFVARFVANHTYVFFKKQAENRGEQSAFVEEMVSGMKTVQAFSRQNENQKKFDEINNRLEKSSMDASFYSSMTNPSTRFINNIVYALVALLGFIKIISGTGFSVGNLTQFLAYSNQYTKPFNEISGVFAELQNSLVCAGRIFEFLLEKEETEDKDNEILSNVNGNVKLDNISFSYKKDTEFIKDMCLDVNGGEHIAIVGKTGCGKTTLINLLMRFYDVDNGAVTVENKDIRTLKRNSLRKNYGMVLQDTWLKKGTIRDNIKMGKEDATEEEIIMAAKNSHAHSFILMLENGYDTVISEDGETLSQGQRQLLCIARTMLSLPPMLILDEATSSVDTRTEQKIGEALDSLMKGRTTFVVAHRLSTIQNADLIIVMDEGKIIEYGKHIDLLEKRGKYFELYKSQFA